MVDWKALSKIDAHIHLTPADVLAANRAERSPFITHGAVQDYLSIMERYHIERAFLMPFNDPALLSMDFTVASVHANLLRLAAAAPEKFSLFADVDLRSDTAATLAEIDRALQNPAFIGIKIHPSNAGYPVDGEAYDPIFAYADAHQVPVEIHAYPREHLPDDVCAPLRIRRVLQKHPGLRLSIAHAGGFQ